MEEEDMNWYIGVLKKYAEFTGRARRKEYWMFVLFNVIFSIVVGIVAGLIRFPLLSTAYSLGVLVPGIAVGIRRMHDTNHSGWFLLVPIYNLILACTNGTVGENRFGADPKAGAPTA
jgi:uncharacterized membrane protein YhaH (DUF805 family)